MGGTTSADRIARPRGEDHHLTVRVRRVSHQARRQPSLIHVLDDSMCATMRIAGCIRLLALIAMAACSGGEPPAAMAKGGVTSWVPPTDAEIPNDSLGAAIRRGLALVLRT